MKALLLAAALLATPSPGAMVATTPQKVDCSKGTCTIVIYEAPDGSYVSKLNLQSASPITVWQTQEYKR